MAQNRQHGRRRAETPKRHKETAKNVGGLLLTGSLLLTVCSPALAIDDGITSSDQTIAASKNVAHAASDFLSATKRREPVTADPKAKLTFDTPKIATEAGPATKLKELELKNAEADAKALEYMKSLPEAGNTPVSKPADAKVDPATSDSPKLPAVDGVTPSKLLSAPLKVMTPTSPFGPRISPITGAVDEFHRGQDYAAACGTEVFAAAGGTVIYSQWHPYGGGNRIEIDHGNGLITTYNHLSSSLVKVGQKVERGDTIALSGTTGASTGCHLHFEVEVNKNVVNPVPWLS